MSTEVWKFQLELGGASIMMPSHCRPLSVAFQGDAIVLWAVVVPSNVHIAHEFYVCVTGQASKHDHRGPFIGTAQHPSGFVIHVFDHGEIPVPHEQPLKP